MEMENSFKELCAEKYLLEKKMEIFSKRFLEADKKDFPEKTVSILKAKPLNWCTTKKKNHYEANAEGFGYRLFKSRVTLLKNGWAVLSTGYAVGWYKVENIGTKEEAFAIAEKHYQEKMMAFRKNLESLFI